ncbi:restriction endonuclease subunit S [Micrococcus aloeverae]
MVSGATPKTGVAEYWGGENLWITPAELSRSQSPIISSTERTLTDAGLKSCAAKILPEGSVLLSSRAPIGLVGITAAPMATNQGFKSLVPGPDVFAHYLFHWLRSHRNLLESMGTGATFKELSKRSVESIVFPLPSLQDQRRIASILDRADERRSRRREQLNRLAMVPGAHLSQIFDGPEVLFRKLGDLGEIQGGLQVSGKRADLPLNYPYLRVANVQRGAIDLRDVKSLGATEREVERVRLREGDLLLVEGHANSAEVGRVARWKGGDDPMLHQNHLIRVRVQAVDADPTFLEAWLNSPHGAAHFARAAKTTSGLNTINITTVKTAPVPDVPIDAQREFAAVVEKIDVQRARVERALALEDELFASLQHRAFRGEL